ncbi:hypothetical protein SDC9_48730 [bioreactor metagenome]|uniref:Helix-turn-helix domain-containing protein n=1 Tax=bioreactor metagenome TaxID=1076179 RepID=A0A644WG74_9ZZZZ
MRSWVTNKEIKYERYERIINNMKNKQKGIVTTGFTPSNNELRLKIVKNCGLSTYGVYIQILSHRNTSTNECFPKNDIIAEECSCSVANVKKHINKLYEFGYLVIDSGYTGKASNYYFPLEIDLNTNKSIYSDAELERISNIKRRTKDNIIEEVPAQDTNKLSDNKTFTPIGKYVDEIIDDVDLFEDDLSETPVKDNITKLNNDSAGSDVDYINEFYVNMHSYYNVNDELLKTNKTISKKVNDLVGFINTELTNNNIENIKAEKIINDIMKNNQKSFNNALNNKSITDDFKKCTYIISCVQNNFKDKKLPTIINNSKVDNFPVADDGFVDYMNDNYITLSNGDNLTKDEAIRRIQLRVTEQNERTIFNIIFGVIGRNNKLNNCSIDIIKNVVDKLNNYFGYEILISDRFDGILFEDSNIAI